MPSTPLTDAIVALTTYANTVTGESDTTLSAAVETLIDGYSGGGDTLVHNWDFTQSLTDTVGETIVTLHSCTQSASGIVFNAASSYISFDEKILPAMSRLELDITSYDRQGSGNGRLVMTSDDFGFAYRSTGFWGLYHTDGHLTGWIMSENSDPEYFNGHTLKIVIDKFGILSAYRDNDLLISGGGILIDGALYIGGKTGNSAYNLTITALRIYNIQ